MFVPIQTPQPSAQALDLGQRIAATVRAYLTDNPGVGSPDVTQAFTVARDLLRSELGGAASQMVILLTVALIGLGVLGVILFLYLNGGGSPRIPMVTMAVAVVGIAAVVMAIAKKYL